MYSIKRHDPFAVVLAQIDAIQRDVYCHILRA